MPAARITRSVPDASAPVAFGAPASSTSAYSSSGCTVSARLPGMVHGVVVQITAETSVPSSATPNRSSTAATSRGRKRTSIAVETLSWYSISASASAVCAPQLQ